MKIESGKTYAVSVRGERSLMTKEVYARDAEVAVVDICWDNGVIQVTPNDQDEVGLLQHIVDTDASEEMDPDAVFEDWEFVSCCDVHRDKLTTEGYWEEESKLEVNALYENVHGNEITSGLESKGFELASCEYLLIGNLDVVEV